MDIIKGIWKVFVMLSHSYPPDDYRPIIITSAILNVIISLVLVKPIGMDGVLIGTFVISLIFCFQDFI